MKFLKVLHYINAAALAIFLPYVTLFNDSFFYSKDAGLELPAIVMFLVTFICSGVIMIKANRSNVDNILKFENIKLINKGMLAYIIVCFATGNILNFAFTNNVFQIIYLAFSSVCSLFVLIDNVLLKLIDHSTFSKIGPPAWVYAFPFIFFGVTMGLNITGVYELNDSQALALFVTYGVLLVLIVWGCPVYTVDTLNNDICYADDFMCSWIMRLKGKDKKYKFEDIKSIRNIRYFYVLEFSEHTIKIPKFYIHTKDLLELLGNLGISIIDI